MNLNKTQKTLIFVSIFAFCFGLDQWVKSLFVNGLSFRSDYVDFILVYNHGVAFSMFAFIGEYLKYIQLCLLVVGGVYLYFYNEILQEYFVAIALLCAGGISNIYDRFTSINGGVVDYVFYHWGFEFAVFNLADVFIDLAIVIILFLQYQDYKNKNNNKSF